MKKYYERYKHAIPLFIYGVIYLSWFSYVEKTVTRPENLIHMKADDAIPFCEIFVVPYFLWFAYVSIIVVYLFFKGKQDYYRVCTFLFTGMTVFLIVSTLWPNGHHLRPAVMPRDNIFTALVSYLYKIDTPTNLWPSIHVYNSLGAHFAIIKNSKLGQKPVIHAGSLILCISIILSTMFIKQHSVFDVLTAFIMAAVMYIVVYGFDIVTIWQGRRYGARKRRVRQV
ncbi:MAG: serine/threonine protein phosphatase [Lachnospiraceae bacterium]|nr:serine/threonine protein phosphatase [Lachnospiraceae bacterium]